MYSVYFKPYPKIKADNLLLRLNKYRDIKDIYEIYKDEEVCKYSDITPYTDIFDARYYYFIFINQFNVFLFHCIISPNCKCGSKMSLTTWL